MRCLPFRRIVIVVALACQVLAGSVSTLSTSHAAAASAVEQPAHCHDAESADAAAGAHHSCGCDGGACNCPCMQVAPLIFATAVATTSLLSTVSPPPASAPPVAARGNSVFRPPI